MEEFIAEVRLLIEENHIKEAFEKLKATLDKSPLTTKLIMLNSRFSDIMDQITSGVVDFEEASVEKNKIRYGLTKLIDEIDVIKVKNNEAKKELEKAITLTNVKNTVVGSSISAGGSVNIGDQSKAPPEILPQTKKKSNPTLYIVIAALAVIIIIMFLWFFTKVGG